MSQEAAITAPVARPSPWADRLAALGERLSDRFNPLVVREVRQGLRTRVFWVTFTLLLVACFIISLVAFTEVRSTDLHSRPSGQMYFYAYFFGLGVVQFLVLPYTAYRSLAREREDETWVLLTLTGLGPRRILRGKLASSLVQSLLYGSAILPFLLLSYFLNGVDLPSILLTIGLGFLYQILLTLLAVSAATLAENRVFRAIVNLAVLGGLMTALGGGLAFAEELTRKGVQMLTHDKDDLIAFGVLLWVMVSSGVLLFEVAVARLSLHTENYAKGPRLALLGQILGSTVLWVLGWYYEKRDMEWATGTHLFFCVYVGVLGIFMASDVDGQAKVHRKVKGFWRAFTPGAIRGYRFVLALLLLSTLVSIVLLILAPPPGPFVRVPHPDGLMAAAIIAPAYALTYLSLPIVLGRTFNLPMLGNPIALRIVTFVLLAAGSGLPPILGEILFRTGDDLRINTFNPVLGTLRLYEHVTGPDETVVLVTNVVLGLVLAVLADRALARRDREVVGGG